MAIVTQEQIDKLQAFFKTLPEEQRNKCALCNETLVHIVKKAEAETGAGTATVTKMLADQINKNAAPADKVTPEALTQRVRQVEGLKVSKRQNKENAINTDSKSGNTGNNLTMDEAVEVMEKEVERGKSTRDAAEIAEAKTGKPKESIRITHQRKKKKGPIIWECKACGVSNILPGRECGKCGVSYATEAMSFAEVSISQLKRIRTDDPERAVAFRHVYKWIKTNGGV